jgi:hypothetical protein
MYIQCRTKQEKINWLHSEEGQRVLGKRPILHEYYHSGYIFQIIDNPHWKVRLEDWLTLPVDEEEGKKVPYGLSLPKTEEEKLTDRTTWLHKPCQNPPLPEVFGEYYDLYRSSPEYYQMPLENRLQILTDGFTILRNIVPLDLVEYAESTIARIASEADVETLEKLGLSKELIYENYRGTRVRAIDQKNDKSKKNCETENEGDTEKDGKDSKKKFSSIFSWSSKAEAVPAPVYERKVNEMSRDPFCLACSTNELSVLALYYASRVHAMIEYLLHADHSLSAPFRSATGGAQVVYRFSQPLPQSQLQDLASRRIGGSSWHIDGLQNGAYGSFSFLVGFPLSDQQDTFAGNLCLHAGSHYALQPWLKDYAMQSAAYEVSPAASAAVSSALGSTASSVAVSGSQRHLLTPAQREEESARLAGRRRLANARNSPVLDEPVQVQISPGDVVVALHKVAHFGGPNYRCKDVRKMVYFRVSHRNHANLRYDALEPGQIWVEYEGLHDLL